MTAATTPPLTYGTITPRTVSQRVAPSPIEASFTSFGTLTKSSWQIDDVIGIIIIARTTIAMSTPACCGVPVKNGVQPRNDWKNGSISVRMKGPRTKMPQRPTTTLGTAASIEISAPTGPRIAGGASSLRNRPIPIESGAAMSSAPNDVTSVPMMNERAPKTFVTGFQTSCQTNATPNSLIAGQEPWISFQPIRTITSTARKAAKAVTA